MMRSSVPVGNASFPAYRRTVIDSIETAPIWLDQLPSDICIRIILYLHPTSLQGPTPECCSLLSLAETTNAQRLAVISALSYRLNVPKQADQVFWSRWGAAFNDDIQELSLHTIIPQTATLLRAPNLRRASVINVRNVLSSVKNAYRLRYLELNLVRYSGASSDETLSALRELNLESLTLSCDIHSVTGCIFTEQSHIIALSSLCQGLQSLKTRCFCNHKVHPTWQLLPRLPRLRKIAVDGRSLQTITDSHFDLLHNMSSVCLDGGDITAEAALRIGKPVTSFRSNWAMEGSELAAVAKCSRLAVLHIGLKRGACRALPSLSEALPLLNSLHLRAVSRGRTLDVDYGDILHAVKNATNLSTLRLTGLRVDTRELVDILKHLDVRLIEFETTVDEMEASQIGQMEVLLETAVKFNTKLRRFDLVSTISVGKRPCHWPSVSRRASKIRLYYERLRLRTPGLYSWSLEKYLHLLEHDVLHEVL